MGIFDLDESVIAPVTDMVSGLGKTAENLATDRNTARHKLDMTSPYKLPHLIRPISLIWGWALTSVLDLLIIGLAFYKMDDPTVVVLGVSATIGAALTMMLKYFFEGRTSEKKSAKAAMANVEMKAMELEAAIEQEEMKLDSDLDDEKLERKIKNRESRRNGRFKMLKKSSD